MLSRWTTQQELTTAAEHEGSESIRHDCGTASCQVPSSRTGKFPLATKNDQNGEARVERRLSIQRNPFQPEVLVCCFRQHGGPEPGRTYQLTDLISAPTPTLNGL
jgi:hypothetical protein